jgi:hypothetical protein
VGNVPIGVTLISYGEYRLALWCSRFSGLIDPITLSEALNMADSFVLSVESLATAIKKAETLVLKGFQL